MATTSLLRLLAPERVSILHHDTLNSPLTQLKPPVAAMASAWHWMPITSRTALFPRRRVSYPVRKLKPCTQACNVGPEAGRMETKQAEEAELATSVSALDKLWQGREDLDSAVFEAEKRSNDSERHSSEPRHRSASGEVFCKLRC